MDCSVYSRSLGASLVPVARGGCREAAENLGRHGPLLWLGALLLFGCK